MSYKEETVKLTPAEIALKQRQNGTETQVEHRRGKVSRSYSFLGISFSLFGTVIKRSLHSHTDSYIYAVLPNSG